MHTSKNINFTIPTIPKVFDQIKRNLRRLQALKPKIDREVFASIITSKSPKDVLIQLEIQKVANTKWTVINLGELFNDYIVARDLEDQRSYTG